MFVQQVSHHGPPGLFGWWGEAVGRPGDIFVSAWLGTILLATHMAMPMMLFAGN